MMQDLTKTKKMERRMIMNIKMKEMLDSTASKLEAIVKNTENASERLEQLFLLFGEISETEESMPELLDNFINTNLCQTRSRRFI
jgi:hypothetical protein